MKSLNPGRQWQVSILVVLLCLSAGRLCAQADAGDEAESAREATAAAISTRQQTQQNQDTWSDEKATLVARYRAAKANVAWLANRKLEEQARVAAITERVDELGRRLDEADRLEASMQDTLLVIFDRLEDDVQRSLPFLPAERRLRLESLAGELVRPDVQSGEKLRRLLEALQIEAGYASTVEVYQDRITIADEELHTDILRLGRVALFWRTPDGDRVGTFDQATGLWAELPDRANRNIALAMEMATRMRPVEIIGLPLGRISP
jgi:hypothetical protein